MDERQRGRQGECARACVHTCVRVHESGPAVGCPSCGCRFERWRGPLSSAAVLGTARRAARLPPGAGCDRPSRRPAHVPFGPRLSRSRTRLSLRRHRVSVSWDFANVSQKRKNCLYVLISLVLCEF